MSISHIGKGRLINFYWEWQCEFFEFRRKYFSNVVDGWPTRSSCYIDDLFKLESMREMSMTLKAEKRFLHWLLIMTETQWQQKSVSNINGRTNKEQAMTAAVLVQIDTVDIRNNIKRVPTTTRSYITINSIHIQPFDSSFKSSTMLIFRCHHRRRRRCRCRRRHRTCHLYFICVRCA